MSDSESEIDETNWSICPIHGNRAFRFGIGRLGFTDADSDSSSEDSSDDWQSDTDSNNDEAESNHGDIDADSVSRDEDSSDDWQSDSDSNIDEAESNHGDTDADSVSSDEDSSDDWPSDSDSNNDEAESNHGDMHFGPTLNATNVERRDRSRSPLNTPREQIPPSVLAFRASIDRREQKTPRVNALQESIPQEAHRSVSAVVGAHSAASSSDTSRTLSAETTPGTSAILPERLVDGNSQTLNYNINCKICFDDIKQIRQDSRQLVTTMCGHFFCDKCIVTSIKRFQFCPVCRAQLSKNQIFPVFP